MPDGEAAPSPLEEKLNSISSRLTELEDLQLVNKLDIINLKNEIEKLRLTTSVPGPEILERIQELGKIVENAEEFKKLKEVTEKIDKIMADVKAGPEGLEDMIRVIDDIDKRVSKLETRGLGMKPGEAQEYAKRVRELKSSLGSLPKGAKGIMGISKQMEKIRLMVEENARNILKLKSAKPRLGGQARREEVVSRETRDISASKAKEEMQISQRGRGPLGKRPVAEPGVIKCPKCRVSLPEHAKFCRKCGAKVK